MIIGYQDRGLITKTVLKIQKINYPPQLEDVSANNPESNPMISGLNFIRNRALKKYSQISN